jgi:signal transduction histidine kinase
MGYGIAAVLPEYLAAITMLIAHILLAGIESLSLTARLRRHGYGVLSVDSVEDILSIEQPFALMIVDQQLLDIPGADPPERLYFLNNSVPVAVLMEQFEAHSQALKEMLHEGSFHPLYHHEIDSGLICKRIDTIFLLARLDQHVTALQRSRDEHERLKRELSLRDYTLQRQQDLNAAIVNSITSGLLIIDMRGDIVLANQTAHRYFEATAPTITGAHFTESLTPQLREITSSLLGRLDQLDGADVRKTRFAERFLEVHGYRLRDPRDACIGLLLLIHDITDQELSSMHLYRAEKLAAIGTMLSGIAHELRNPLAIISARAQRCSGRSAQLPDWASRGFESIEAQSRRCADIVNTLLDYSRTSGQPAGIHDIGAILEESLKYAACNMRFDTIELHKTFGPGLAVFGDRSRYVQIFVNVITNAAQAMHGSGIMEISTARLPSGAITISICDTGDGIAPEHVNRIFDPFFTTKAPGEGTGLGLAIVQKIVRDSGGVVRFTSRPGQTVCSIELPSGEESLHASAYSAG